MRYITAACFCTSALLIGSVASRKRMLERGSPCLEPFLTVMSKPCLPLTSTHAKPTSVYWCKACTMVSGIPNALSAWMMTVWPTLSNAFSTSKLTSWRGLLFLLAFSMRCVAKMDGFYIPFCGMKPCWCGPMSLGSTWVSLLERMRAGMLYKTSSMLSWR